MTTLQEYLNQLENKAQIKEINLIQIQQVRGENELLEGGELDLTEFLNLEKVEIDPRLLKTPLTKLNVDGLTHLKELDWLETKADTPEEKKLWEELGIEGENEKKAVVREVQRLAEIKGIKVNFGEKKAGENEEGIFLQLDQKDKQGNFCSSLIFWTLAQELARGENSEEITKTPDFWKRLEPEKAWVKENLTLEYQKDFELLLNPTTFPIDKLEIKELLTVYYPNSEEIPDKQESKITTKKEIADKTWQTIQKELLELTSQELSKNPEEEELKKLTLKVFVSDNYEIIIQHHQQNPFKEKIEELIITVPLQSKLGYSEQTIKDLEKQLDQLPTPENLEKLTKQNQLLENYLQDLTDEEKFKEIKDKINNV